MTAACDVPCVNNRAASNRRASNAAMRRRPRGGVVMPQHRMVLDDIHHFISRGSLVLSEQVQAKGMVYTARLIHNPNAKVALPTNIWGDIPQFSGATSLADTCLKRS